MFSITKRMGVIALIGVVALGLAVPEVQGQRYGAPMAGENPTFRVGSGLTPQSYARNVAPFGRADGTVPLAQQGPNQNCPNGNLGSGAFNAGPYGLYGGPVGRTTTAYGPPGYGLGANSGPRYGNYGVGYSTAAPSNAYGGPGPTAAPYSTYGGPATPTTNPYGGYNSGNAAGAYGNAYGTSYDPFSGYLRGGAEVINAQSGFLASQQQANLLREQVAAERIANRRRIFDAYQYERAQTPTREQEREWRRIQERDRSRADPPATEIWSGKALNDLLVDVQMLQDQGLSVSSRDPQVPLEDELLKRINVTATRSAGQIGLLKNGGRLSWPIGLSGAEFQEKRERLTSLAREAVRQAQLASRVDAGTLKQMRADMDQLERQLTKTVRDSPPAQYIEAKRYLNHFQDALTALEQPDVGRHFTVKYGLAGKTVPELVKYMTDQGLRFAPAVAGDESAYLALHRALTAYDVTVAARLAEQR